jgi:hypothetical protein
MIRDLPVTVEPFQFSPAESVAYKWGYLFNPIIKNYAKHIVINPPAGDHEHLLFLKVKHPFPTLIIDDSFSFVHTYDAVATIFKRVTAQPFG